MMMFKSFLLLLVAIFSLNDAFIPKFGLNSASRASSKPTSLNSIPSDVFSSMLVVAVEVIERPDDYVYGAVAAPSWALPLGAVLVIGTAAIPLFLKPGEEVRDSSGKIL